LDIYINNIKIFDETIPNTGTTLDIQFILKKGENDIKFYAPEGYDKPSDIPELNSQDARHLSFGFKNITLIDND
jgi:hypothetical protein